ncbi:Hint domain-containing protein [Pseudooceanicola sp. CBS1P-1]|uniref:Hemolysin n=1 Tax=Pseudooceanicola albus TaxID=2692189 RepID=A0A6L7GAE8_9RHOB|nr:MULTISPECIES: Hint domain-containing protein [Pseudooceanicola]MBT9386669.1 Hint domain-containing protein [Pseudooceanicola endophyticus]MXN20919.1 hemolysin [Pseudooceanicola albus]
MATSFSVIYLGNVADLDPTEGNDTLEDEGTLVGTTFGSASDPLGLHVHTFAPGSTGASQGDASYYDNDNSIASDTFTIDGGADRVFDSTEGYVATITYTDGTTATITAVVFQDTNGDFFLATELSQNADQDALDAKPIQSMTFTATNGGFSTGMFTERAAGNFQIPICFAAGTGILTPAGLRPVEALRPGDRVCTLDNGPQPLVWVGRQHLGPDRLRRQPGQRPILLPEGYGGARRPVLLSPQHAVLLGRDHLVRAKHLPTAPGAGVRIAWGKRQVTYHHLMCERHEILWADGLAPESFYPGPVALAALGPRARRGLILLCPGLGLRGAPDTAPGYGTRVRPLLGRHALRQGAG